MSDKRDKSFQDRKLRLSEQDIKRLAGIMQSMPEPDLEGDSDGALEETRINAELHAAYGRNADGRPFKPDPTSRSDDQLWERLRESLPPRRRSRFRAGFMALAAAAAALLLWNPWADPESRKLHKGVPSNARPACSLALKTEGGLIELHESNIGLSPNTAILVMARCQRSGYLHFRWDDGTDQVILANVKFSESAEWHELRDEASNPVGIMTPSRGRLRLSYGMTETPWPESRLQELDLSERLWPIMPR